jgi:type I restriction enzyme S subunit
LQAQWQRGLFANICNRWIGQAAVQRDKLLSLEILLPSLPEQKRIATILTEQLADVERARAAAKAQLEAAKALPAAYLRVVFDSPEARKWPRKRLEEVAILERGKFTPRPRNDPRYFGGPYPWIQIGEVEAAKKYIRHHRGTLNDLGLSVSKMFPKGTLVISIAASIGAVGILGFDSCMPDSLVGVTPRTDMSDSEFLYYILLSIREHLESIAPQMAQANLKLAMLNPFEIFLPPLGEQKRIAAILNEQLAIVDRVRKTLEEELSSINALPSTLLHQAFNGEL